MWSGSYKKAKMIGIMMMIIVDSDNETVEATPSEAIVIKNGIIIVIDDDAPRVHSVAMATNG